MAINAPQPATEQANPYLPPGPPPLTFEQFEGINTATTRPGVDDKQAAWLDGWMPLAPRNLRVMPDIGTALWTAPLGDSVVFFDFANIGATPYMIAVTSTGGIWAVNTITNAATQIAPNGTIINPTRTVVGITQWGSQYVIIVAQQPNGYWLWNGTIFTGAGTLAPPVTVTAGGTNYSNPVVTASGGSGSGASFTAVVSAGVIVSIAITNPGSGYLSGDTVTINIADASGSGATATVGVMPFGISGNSVEVYTGHVWVANGPSLAWSAPGSFSNFATSAGGGSIVSSSSYLRVGYVQLKSTNGFLYLIGDSSIDYISGVQTSGVPPTTTFTNQNADPEVGTPWPATVDTWSRNLVFANAFGAHISYGAAVTKISEMLDGVYNTVPNFGGFTASAAKAIIFGKKVWILLLRIVDPITGLIVNKLFLWNSKIWWSSNQSVALIYIQHQEINSVLTAYGTDGRSVYPLFQTPSNAFTKTAQSKFWTAPGGYQFIKAASRLWVLFLFTTAIGSGVTISVDSEHGSSPVTYSTSPQAVIVKNASGTIIPTKNQSGATIPVFSVVVGNYPLPPAAVGQQGVMTGLTFTTTEKDITLISAMLQDEIAQYRG